MKNEKTQNILIEIYKTIKLPNVDEKVLYKSVVDFSSLNTRELDQTKELTLDVFYLISAHIKDRELANSKLIDKYKKSFENIRTLDTNGMQENSKILVFKFLKELHNNILDQEANKDTFKKMCENIEEIFEELDSIRYVFRIQNEDKTLFFPISYLLFNVLLNDEQFYDNDTLIYKIRIALEIFKTGEFDDEKNILSQMEKKYNIKLISYMMDASYMIVGGKEKWKDHLKKNKVICIVRNQNEVYIRHPSKSYFTENIIRDYNIDKIQNEKNYNGCNIAYFVEFKLNDNIQLTSIKDILLKDDYKLKIDLLFLLFNKKYKNIFLENSLYIDQNKIHLINPFCKNDKYLITLKNQVEIKSRHFDKCIMEALDVYYQNNLIGNELDFMMVGSLIKLLRINGDLNEDFFNNLDKITNNFQNSIILKWLDGLPENERITSLSELLSCFGEDVKYVSTYSIEIKDLEWFAFKLPVNEILKCILSNEKICIISDASLDMIYRAENRNGVVIKNKNGEEVDENEIVCNGDYNEGECLLSGGKYYLDKTLIAAFKIREKISKINQNLNDFSDYIEPKHINGFKQIRDVMDLQKYALLRVGEIKCNPRSIYNIRILNHLFAHEITIDKQEDFIHMIQFHGITNFKEGCEELHRLFESNILVVPKERVDTDNTLSSVYEQYLKLFTKRQTPIHSSSLDIKGDKYYLDGVEIKKIYFLFDTVLSGKQTKDNLINYFPEYKNKFKNAENIKDRSQKYICEERTVTIKEIMEKNGIDKVTCVFINYADDCKWEKKVDNFFKTIGLKYKIEKCKSINFSDMKTKCIFNFAEKIYNHKIKDNFYPLIREFNMPKRSVFPKDEMNHPEWISSIFVLKKEFECY